MLLLPTFTATSTSSLLLLTVQYFDHLGPHIFLPYHCTAPTYLVTPSSRPNLFSHHHSTTNPPRRHGSNSLRTSCREGQSISAACPFACRCSLSGLGAKHQRVKNVCCSSSAIRQNTAIVITPISVWPRPRNSTSRTLRTFAIDHSLGLCPPKYPLRASSCLQNLYPIAGKKASPVTVTHQGSC